MKIRLVFATAILIALTLLLIPKSIVVSEEDISLQKQKLNALIEEFLTSKDSPLAPNTEFLLQQKHWKLLIAISAIESQYCKRQLGNNCWGVGGDSDYRHYSSIRAAIIDANDLIEYWQEKGRWLTVEDMNGHYVFPSNPNWVHVVNKVLEELGQYEQQSIRTIHQ